MCDRVIVFPYLFIHLFVYLFNYLFICSLTFISLYWSVLFTLFFYTVIALYRLDFICLIFFFFLLSSLYISWILLIYLLFSTFFFIY